MSFTPVGRGNVLEADLQKIFGADGCAGVRHVDLASAHVAPDDCDAGMIVLWRGRLPVGHLLKGSDGQCRRVPPVAAARDSGTALGRFGICRAPAWSSARGTGRTNCGAAFLRFPNRAFPPAEVIVVDNASRGGETREVALCCRCDSMFARIGRALILHAIAGLSGILGDRRLHR